MTWMTIISSILGLLGSITSNLLSTFSKKKDVECQLALQRLQMEQNSQEHQQALERLRLENEVKTAQLASDEYLASLKHDVNSQVIGSTSKLSYLNDISTFIRGLMRPLLTIGSLILLIIFKGDEKTFSIISDISITIISWWFADRTFSTYKQNRKA